MRKKVFCFGRSYKNMSYFALGSGKTIMLNTTLFNAGDDAFLPKMHLRFPSNLHYIKVLDAVSATFLPLKPCRLTVRDLTLHDTVVVRHIE